MRLSIIVPVYNCEKYISICLNSLLNQDISKDDYEVICVDDGSVDKSAEILDDFSRIYNNIHVIHKENQGTSKARNEGIQYAKGDYLCRFSPISSSPNSVHAPGSTNHIVSPAH